MLKNYTMKKEFETSFSISSLSPFSSTSTSSDLPLFVAKTKKLSDNFGNIEYKIEGITQNYIKTQQLFPKGHKNYQIKVCIFGDFSQNLYEDADLNLSEIIEKEKCQLNIFIGKIAWERQLNPTPSFSFSPYVMLHSNTNPKKHSAFSKVASIFGKVGGNMTETSFFQCTRVGDIAFIQMTVEIATVANLIDGSKAFEMIGHYFRETMLNELECKLQELHQIEKRPWIILFITHPFLVSNDENKVQWFVMNDTHRFFDILKRYKVDFLTSCGIEGMSRMLIAARKRMPDAKLPEYIQTTMAQCGGYQSVDITLQNECTYATLNISPKNIYFKKKYAEGKESGKIATEGEIKRTFRQNEEADRCIPDEL
ncbi:hypothetical protein Mgra_00005716 [Meloidogyne graminicola]|uniref:Uncharacterized protein n=1 Tax=Meloidogyne graminicola TaxID=189291 RepID=A0A8S9ZNP9_9BILA|nr:hypothetical protein Mgra_00005716 [Meloidogyne graminicola]